MKESNSLSTDVKDLATEEQVIQPISAGLRVRTGLRAGISLEEVGDQISGWWSNLTTSLSSAIGGGDASA